jgi:anti-sigma factor RsiW
VNCEDLQIVLHGYVDGELDLVRHLDVEQHLTACPNCARACKQLQALQSGLRSSVAEFVPPADLRRRIENSLREVEESPSVRRRGQGWLALAAAALVVFGIWGLLRLWPAENDRLALAVVAGHVRSLMIEGHLYDVKSSDQHTVKPWFHGKLDFAPVVPDLSEEGFTLTGGRLDYLDGHTAAALIYHRRKHAINLFVWPTPQAADEPPQGLTRQGYNLLHWTRGGLTYWAVSDLNATELRAFADLFARQTPRASLSWKASRPSVTLREGKSTFWGLLHVSVPCPAALGRLAYFADRAGASW